jgi:hypothetical protein
VNNEQVAEHRLMMERCMNVLRRDLPVAVVAREKSAAEATVTRRIEVTVERETVTVLVRGQPKAGKKKKPPKGN